MEVCPEEISKVRLCTDCYIMIFAADYNNYSCNGITRATSQILERYICHCESAENAFRCPILSETTWFNSRLVVLRIFVAFPDGADEYGDRTLNSSRMLDLTNFLNHNLSVVLRLS
jgi:hypothetical protein